MTKSLIYICLLLLFFSCKKAEDRACFKGWGEETEVEIPLDSVNEFMLGKNMNFRIIQDSLRLIKIKGGEHMVKHIQLDYEDHALSIVNKNKCEFLRDAEHLMEIEIHYPYYKRFFIEPSDSVIFEDTIRSENLSIEIRNGGGSVRLHVETQNFSIVVSEGPGDYVLTGTSNNAEVKVQANGFADASGFTALGYFVYQNSTGDLKVNLDGAYATVQIDGIGDVLYTGTPIQLNMIHKGEGKFIQE